MEHFLIKGGRPLAGEIEVSGSKNAFLPVLAAALLTDESCRIENIPLIQDGENALAILEGLGAKITRQGKGVLINSSGLNSFAPAAEIVRKFRGSILFAGALLGRCGKVVMPYPGGDIIGSRPLDVHLEAFRALGADISETPDHFLKIEASKLKGNKIVFSEISVTATENALLAGVLAEGETVIKMAATEPHVQDLADFLNEMGAKIEGAGTNIIRIRGVKKLHAAEHVIIPDSDEAMSLATLAAATRSDILIKKIEPEFLDSGLEKLKAMAVNFELGNDWLHIKKPIGLYQASKIQSGLYPKLMTDQIPPLAVLATQASGVSLIHEWMYEGRLGYINELIKMGANAVALDPHRALIIGPTPLRGNEVKALDVRSGMTMIIAALVAEGESTLNEAFHIDRGYEKIEERLQKLGADIVRKA
ncbi:MAG: UDP-N-acetylglucosamine 1-carboxyvinyltransferase [Candidatus Paceibacterota bacterium]